MKDDALLICDQYIKAMLVMNETDVYVALAVGVALGVAFSGLVMLAVAKYSERVL